MEDITHVTPQGTSSFTLASTNKLLKQYEWATGLKTGSTKKAKFCLSATAKKDDIELIAVIMAAPDYKIRFQEAMKLLNYGYSVSAIYVDENTDKLEPISVKKSVQEEVALTYEGPFRYLDLNGNNLSNVEKIIQLPEYVEAPVSAGTAAGEAVYKLGGKKIGSVPILFVQDVSKAVYKDYLKKAFMNWLL